MATEFPNAPTFLSSQDILAMGTTIVQRTIADSHVPLMPMRRATFNVAAYGSGMGKILIAAAAGTAARLTAPELQSVQIGLAMGVCGIRHKGKLPIVPDTLQARDAAKAAGTSLDPSKNAWIVLTPFGASVTDKNSAAAIDRGCRGLRALRTAKPVTGTAMDAAPVSFPGSTQTLAPLAIGAIVAIIGFAIAGGAYVEGKSMEEDTKRAEAVLELDAKNVSVAAKVSALVQAELSRQMIYSKTGTDPGLAPGFAEGVQHVDPESSTRYGEVAIVGAVLVAAGVAVGWLVKDRTAKKGVLAERAMVRSRAA